MKVATKPNGIEMDKRKVSVIALFTLLCVSAAAYWLYSTVLSNPKDNLPQFMSARYGVLDPADNSWRKPTPAKADAAEPAGFKICADNDSTTDNKVFLLAVCSVPGKAGGSHSDSGTIELYAIDRSKPQFTIVSALTMEGFGSFGNPGTVKIIQLGTAFFGFQIEGGGVWQGVSIGTTVVYVPYKDTFKEALVIRSAYNDEGRLDCENCADQITELERTLEIKPDGQADMYPIQINEKSKYLGKQTSHAYWARFDKDSWRYIYPKELERESGNQE